MKCDARTSGVFSFALLVAVAACASPNAVRVQSAAAAAADEAGVHAPRGFALETVAAVAAARELTVLPNGDLLVGTGGSDLYIVPDAEGKAGAPQIFASFDDKQSAGVTSAAKTNEIYVGTMHHVFAISYRNGDRRAEKIHEIAGVRTGPVAPGTDGDIHTTTSVAYTGGFVYAAAGSSCNATMDDGRKPCTEVDPTRAAVSVMRPDGSHFEQRAKRIRNAIALAVNPDSGALWVGGAGQDDLPAGHPYEFLDNLSANLGDADYGWPECEENHHAYWPGYDCTKTVEPLVELPAYSTIIGAAFYPTNAAGVYVFPARYRGGIFAAVHGSWHRDSQGCDAAPTRVVFIPMNGDRPRTAVDWKDPTTQWSDFLTGLQSGCTTRVGRATGVAVGPKGSLFVADDAAGRVYRIRPAHRGVR